MKRKRDDVQQPSNPSTRSNSDSSKQEPSVDWVKRTRPGGNAKTGSNLKSPSTSSSTKTENETKRNHDNSIPSATTRNKQSSQQTQQNNQESSYFSKVDVEKEEKEVRAKREHERKKAEKDCLASASGNRRREVEDKIGAYCILYMYDSLNMPILCDDFIVGVSLLQFTTHLLTAAFEHSALLYASNPTKNSPHHRLLLTNRCKCKNQSLSAD